MFKNRQQISVLITAFALTFVFDSSALLPLGKTWKQALIKNKKKVKKAKKKKSYLPQTLTRKEKAALMLQHIRLMQDLKRYFQKRNRV